MYMAHKMGILIESSSDFMNSTGFPGDACFAPNPSWKEKAFMFTTVTIKTYQDQINAGFSKVCEVNAS